MRIFVIARSLLYWTKWTLGRRPKIADANFSWVA
jgi:hypothetical protein